MGLSSPVVDHRWRGSAGASAAVQAQGLLARLCAGDDEPRPAPSAVVVVAHPDDEVIGAGSRLPRLRDAILVHVTDGSPRDLGDARAAGCATRLEYARMRRNELAAARALAGISLDQTRELGCVDQEAALNLEGLSRRLAALLEEVEPEMVLTHPYEGGHPDHDATAFIVHAACRLLEKDGGRAPVIIEMTSYHNGPEGITVFEFLPGSGAEAVTIELTAGERKLKERMMACYPTQWNTLRLFPVGIERFRPAPRYDFTRPPHEGLLFYECFPWGMTGSRFCDLARKAIAALGIEGER